MRRITMITAPCGAASEGAATSLPSKVRAFRAANVCSDGRPEDRTIPGWTRAKGTRPSRTNAAPNARANDSLSPSERDCFSLLFPLYGGQEFVAKSSWWFLCSWFVFAWCSLSLYLSRPRCSRPGRTHAHVSGGGQGYVVAWGRCRGLSLPAAVRCRSHDSCAEHLAGSCCARMRARCREPRGAPANKHLRAFAEGSARLGARTAARWFTQSRIFA